MHALMGFLSEQSRVGSWLDWPDVTRSIHCPALIITADPQKGAIITPNLPGGPRSSRGLQVVHIPGAGHNIRRENYLAFMQAVRNFLKS